MQRIVGKDIQKSMVVCILQNPEVVGHPGFLSILHLTYYVLGHTNSLFCLLYSIVVCDLERSKRLKVAQQETANLSLSQ